MAGFEEKIKNGWKEVRGNLAVELAKWIGGSTVTGAIFKAISQAANRVPVDWMLFACLLVFGFVLIFVALYQGGANKKTNQPQEAPLSPETDPASHAALVEQNELIQFGRSLNGLFSELQIEALRLRRDLQRFLASESDRLQAELTGDEAARKQIWKLVRHNRDYGLTARYQLEIKDWAVMVSNRFMVEGIKDHRFASLAVAACSCENIADMVDLLWQMIGELGKYRDDKA